MKNTKKTVKKAKKAVVHEKSKDISSIPLYDSKGKEVGKFQLNKELFDGKVNKAVIYQAILMYNANARQGNASTKTRGDVSGGGKKPFRQKGTGRARAGSTRSPLWRGGGTIFGPHPRDFYYSLPKKITKLALLSSLNSKVADSKFIGLDSLNLEAPKTKLFKAVLDALKLEGKSLFVFDTVDEKVKIASRNLQKVFVKNYKDFNTMDVLNCDTLVMSKAALEKLKERFEI